ncbi:uncharacterized protein LOC121863236 isoform X2 [Homarus americanus]|uniref:uncharacterized protein LOC121863236 isoform X2 n=1 Tax=Homarus americanus TaxID=6706 RepID=UPI001C45121C|nr:uncharacterized protein LOC121863236 isoform X2 [Homarus americanus]
MKAPRTCRDSRWLCPLLILGLLVTSINGVCELPNQWRGGWFQSGVRDIISITRTEFSSKGVCVRSSGEKFLFKDKNDVCFRCVVISEKHPNILQYKETLCEPSRDLKALCSQITGDALLFSMFRRDSPPAPCPFKGPLTFSYTRGHGQCTFPASTIDSCTSDSRLLFKYQACPDVLGTESSVEEVECIGHWKEGSTRYFVGRLDVSRTLTDEDRYRCFGWERARENEANIDYHLAQSFDATCNGVFPPFDGSKTLRIKKVGSYSGCEFPSWVSSHRRWHALDRGASYSVAHHNTTLRLHHAHNSRTQPTPLGLSQEDEEEGDTERTKVSYAGTEARLVCSQQRDTSASRVVLVTHLTTGCSSGYVCTVLYRREGHIIEMQQGSRAIRAVDACHPMFFNASSAPHTTLTSGSPSRRACPIVGVWTAGKGECGRDVTHLRAGCGALHALQFVHACSTETTKHSFVCHGHWAEGDSMFVVASPHDRPSHRLCLTATSITNSKHSYSSRSSNNSNNNSRILQVTAHAHSCPRRHVPPTTTLSFNLTAQGECTVASSSTTPHVSTQLFPVVILLSLLHAASEASCSVYSTR